MSSGKKIIPTLRSLSKAGIMAAGPFPGKGVNALDILLNFFVSVAAGIIGNYISKWLDRHRKGR